MKPRAYYEHLLEIMDPGLERAVLSILRFHVGIGKAISKEPLMLTLEKIGFHTKDERQVRVAIVRLRKLGVPVCSSSTESGYFLPETYEEFREFIGREYWKKVRDMVDTAKAMEEKAGELFSKEHETWKSSRNADVFRADDFDPDSVPRLDTPPVQSKLF